jgi:hypothetical protein
MRNIPAKLFDYRALTLKAEVQTDLAGIFTNIGSHLDITSGLRGHQGRRTVRILGALQRLLKTGGRLAKHARYHWLTHAKSHVTLRRFWGIRPKKSRRDRTG